MAKVLFEVMHEDDEFLNIDSLKKKEKEENRLKDYEYALQFRREYHKRVLEIADLWKVKIMHEDDLPKWRKNVMKCEDNTGAFSELKLGRFF
jgi:hypothetical protein